MIIFRIFLVVIGVILPFATNHLRAQAEEPGFRMISAKKFASDEAQFQIIGGTLADPLDWPATFVIDDRCTSTAVGPRVVLTAAHCVPDGAVGLVEFGGTTISATCNHHPDYREGVSGNDPEWEQKVSPDFALCILSSSLEGIEFETIDVDGSSLQAGAIIRLLGFGCNSVGGTDGGFGVLYEGDAAITKAAAPPSYYTTTLGGAAVCYGDSGGGDYMFLDAAEKRRVLVAVTSRGDIATRSWLSTTSVPGFVAWADSWGAQHGGRICGLHHDASNCRQK